MKGRTCKTRKKKTKKTLPEKVPSNSVSSPATQNSDAVFGSDDISIGSQSPVTSSPRTPRRSKRQIRHTEEICLTSTPVHKASAGELSNILPGVKQVVPESRAVISEHETSEVDSPPSKSRSNNKGRRGHTYQKRQVKSRIPKEQTQNSSRPAKQQRGRKQRNESENLEECTTTERKRPRFELEEHDSAEQDDTLLSSDLSIELSQHEEQVSFSSLQEEEESDDELPSFLEALSVQLDKKPAITEGAFVWHKFRNYPFWPALVKNVNRKQKKASIMFIDYTIFEKKKGFAVALKSLKPFDCEESNKLMHKAKEQNDVAISWSSDLITDYRFRIACGSFSGSFIDYVSHDMSFPVRKKYSQETVQTLTIASDALLAESCEDLTEDGLNEQQEEVNRSKRLLPDRTHAAHTRANEKLVDFIVKQRMVEGHLLAVIRRQQPSRWLCSFLKTNRRRVVKTYLEDEEQLDQVYWYLNKLYATAMTTEPCPAKVKSVENVPFVMDVLLPEAIINAIAGVDNVTIEKAEEKYLQCRSLSNREREELAAMIDRQIWKKSRLQKTEFALLSDHSS